MSVETEIRLRRGVGFLGIGALLLIDVYATGLLGGSERTLAMVRSIVLPGLPFLEWHAGIGLATITLALVSISAWLRWGMDWLPVVVMAGSIVVAAWVMPLHHDPESIPQVHDPHYHESNHNQDHHAIVAPADGIGLQSTRVIAPVLASHEFTIILVIFAFLARLRLLLGRLPVLSAWIKRHFPAAGFDAVDTARTAAIRALGGSPKPADWTSDHPRLLQRARRINQFARWRFGGDPLSGSHAATRAALCLMDDLTDQQRRTMQDEASVSPAGILDSEPTWVRPLDAMLVALALHRSGNVEVLRRWEHTFEHHFPLRHGRRAAVLHRPTMLALGTLEPWAQATLMALRQELGWVTGDEWSSLRQLCLGIAARGAEDAASERLIAAGRWCAQLVKDEEALTILGRRTLRGDDLALAIDQCRRSFR